MAKKPACVLIFAFFILFSTSALSAADEINKNFHRSFDVKKGDALSLRFGDGNVKIVPWEKDVIDVSVRYRADIAVAGVRLGGRNDFEVEFRQTSDTVYVTGKEPSGGAIGFYNEKVYEYVYEIHAPDYVRLDLEGDDGDVTVENWAAEIDCRIDDGDVQLKSISGGRTAIRGEDGDVKIEKLTGDLTIGIDDGDVTLTACDLGSCRVESEDGNVTVRQSGGSFDITVDDGNVVMENIKAQLLHIVTADGDIEVELLAGPTLDAELQTDDGDIRIDLERGFPVSFNVSADDPDYIHLDLEAIEGYKEDRYGKSGSINGGDGRLRIRTADGDVEIREKR
ncbi:MAG: DUF4097 family beta strand repeat-containing protein [Candidatus Aminicenantales bacterium]